MSHLSMAAVCISIHALLTESDRGQRPNWGGCQTFLSTLSLRRATPSHSLYLRNRKFLSTLSLRRATLCLSFLRKVLKISIHALLTESDCSAAVSVSTSFSISIHALLTESDCLPICKYGLPLIFLSTLSLRRATHWQVGQKRFLQISIHALLTESDYIDSEARTLVPYFYPRSPYGERHTMLNA